jgi:tetratricopeptide (TPR) repeat protein
MSSHIFHARGRRCGPLFPPLVLILTVMVGPQARADTPPGTWDLAKDPIERDRFALHVRVERLVYRNRPDDIPPVVWHHDEELRLEAARAMLEQAAAERSPDVRLRFDLGIVYELLATNEQRDDLHKRVIDVLVPALELAPDHPAATEALESLVYAYAKLDRPREELLTWRRYIARLVDQNVHLASSLMNMGEAQMRLGRLDEAIATFRNTLQICGGLPNSSARNATHALTLWDLAVSLDRSGDPRAAIETANEAKEFRWKEPTAFLQWPTRDVSGWDAIQDHENVFFVPEWERDWYLALGYTAAARAERDARQAANLWHEAEGHWDTYVTHASAPGADNRWAGIARLRRDRARAERVDAERRAKLAPRGKQGEVRPSEQEL